MPRKKLNRVFKGHKNKEFEKAQDVLRMRKREMFAKFQSENLKGRFCVRDEGGDNRQKY